MRTLPTSVRIGAQVYTVIPDPNLAAEDDCFGQWNSRRLTIRIDCGAHEDRQAQTLMHEALEAMNHEYHVKLTHDQIEQLEAALFALSRDNPGVFG